MRSNVQLADGTTVPGLETREPGERLDPLRFQQPLKLDIGAGAHPRDESYTTVDLHAEPAHIKAPMWDIPLPDGCVAAIWSSHALEHVAFAEVPKTLAEWFRLLRPGCRAIVQVPSFDYIARYWLLGPERSWAEQMIFGNQQHAGEFHKSCWNHAVLKADLEKAGFVDVRVEMRWSHNQETLQAVARKPLGPPPPAPSADGLST